MINHGVIEFLEKAYKEGTYLIVGLHDDNLVKSYKGNDFPIMGQ